jgi:hypothetical protein
LGIERQIAVSDKKIDGLVYEFYGLTEEEIKIVHDQNSHFHRRLGVRELCQKIFEEIETMKKQVEEKKR